MKVVFCSSEVFPFAKTGGLADVSGALPFALAKAGCEVKVFMPWYKNITPRQTSSIYGYTKQGEVEFYFIRHDKYFKREFLYGTPQGDYPDNLERFSFFSRQVFNVLAAINFSPQIIHSNEWQTALVNIYLKLAPIAPKRQFSDTKAVLTIHNLAYQGVFSKDKYPLLGIPGEYFSVDYLEFYNQINLLKGGIIFSDRVNTVSPTYVKQVQTPDYGCGLDGVLREHRAKISGILNGNDYRVWNPQKDKLIYKNYSARTCQDKYVNKRRLQKSLGLAQGKPTLLLGMVSRLTEQKGVDILCAALDNLLPKYQLVVLGVGDEKYHKIFKKAARKSPRSFSLHWKFDEALAHKIYAACDCFLMPSRFEPCGLAQMISYKYGTLPIVHHVGGLVDTVVDTSRGGGGFVFSDYNSSALSAAVERAGMLFAEKKKWAGVMTKVMAYDFSWDAAADKYMEMYKRCRSGE